MLLLDQARLDHRRQFGRRDGSDHARELAQVIHLVMVAVARDRGEIGLELIGREGPEQHRHQPELVDRLPPRVACPARATLHPGNRDRRVAQIELAQPVEQQPGRSRGERRDHLEDEDLNLDQFDHGADRRHWHLGGMVKYPTQYQDRRSRHVSPVRARQVGL